VLQDPDSFRAKEKSKLGVLEGIMQPELYPELYGDIEHQVSINYYPPRGDNKEGWDNIDIFGWLGYPMQLKVNFLCRDSILAAPLVLDLLLFTDLAQRAGMRGIQEWLSFYFKSPQCAPGVYPDGGPRAARRGRPVHPADQAQEHPALPGRRGTHHPPRARVLRLLLLNRPSRLRTAHCCTPQRGGKRTIGIRAGEFPVRPDLSGRAGGY
jgi:Myo-inositol-1-phosphate synthase